MTTWVLLRGLTRERAHWGGFGVLLAEADPGARVIALDLPGAGALWQRRCPWRVESMVGACREQLADRSAAPPYHLLGLSLGAMVALAWAAATPEEVAGCVLVNSSLRPFSPPWQRLRWRRLPALLRLLLTRDALCAESTILQLTSAAPTRHDAVLADWVAIRAGRPVSAGNTLRQLGAAARFHAPPSSGVPLLVVRGAADGLVDPRCSQAIATAFGAELLTHPDAGHDLPLDAGPWLASNAAAWAQRLRLRDKKPSTPRPASSSA